jgi:4-amino-4-deoxy-L-arabinose transferase-like glycosyltransferase
MSAIAARLTPSPQLRSFVLIGLACTAAYALLYSMLRHAGMGAMAANAVSLTATMGANFAANRHYSFKASDGPLGTQLAGYAIAYLLGLAASSLALAVLLALLGHPTGAVDTFAAVFAGLAATGVRYVLMSGWVFRPETSPTGGESLVRDRSWALSLRAVRPELVALLVLAAVLNLWALSKNGWANDYYAATVRSMASSWHNFLYDSFDPSGVMTVDKPPLALWVQALSVRVFGFHSLSVLVPQALMGMASVGLVYDLTRRRFGRSAGFVAGLVLATTPMTVAISRHNNPDALLVLCCVAALWFLVRGLEDGRTRWLVLSGVAIGLGFETKMLVALMVLPGIALAWLWMAPRGRAAAVRQLLAGGFAMAVVGCAWPLLMTLTPASSRPWISGTSDNSIWSLIFGYNGLGRIDGQSGGPAGAGPGGGGGGGGGFFGGSTGPFRLFNSALGGQAGWLLGVAVVGGIALIVVTRLRRSDARTGWLIATGGAFVTCAVAFSFAKGIFHPYYVSLLAPFTAALVGAAASLALRRDHVARVVGPLAVAGGVVTELIVLHNTPGQLTWLPPVLIVGGIAAAVALAVGTAARIRNAVLVAALGLLIWAPATWAFDTLGHATSGTFPSGGPVSATTSFGGPGGGGGRFSGGPPGAMQSGGSSSGSGSASGSAQGGFPGAPPTGTQSGSSSGSATGGSSSGSTSSGSTQGGPGGGAMFGGSAGLSQAVAYVNAHGGGTIAVSSQSGASAQIIASGAKVAGIGGFSGRESQVSIQWLAQQVASGKIRWILVDSSGSGMMQDGRVGSSQVMAAVAKVGKQVSYGGSSGTLYDLQGQASALLSAL